MKSLISIGLSWFGLWLFNGGFIDGNVTMLTFSKMLYFISGVVYVLTILRPEILGKTITGGWYLGTVFSIGASIYKITVLSPMGEAMFVTISCFGILFSVLTFLGGYSEEMP